MAVACLPAGLLVWALSVQLADTCLCCWPDEAKFFSYDAQLLVGGNKDIAQKLERLFLGSSGKCAIYGGKFLERDDMEREAGNLFLQLRAIVQKNVNDPERLMTEAGREKQNFSKRLEEASNTFLKEICNNSCERIRFQPYEVAECGGCRLLKAPCKDAVVCAGSNVLAGVLVTLAIVLGAGTGVWYYRRKKSEGEEEEEAKAQEDGGSESSWSSEWSDDTDSPAEEAPKSTTANFPSPPEPNFPEPPPAFPIYENVPPLPSPPHIWSPPN